MKDKKTLQTKRDYTITKANELIQQSRYSLTVQQQRIILYLISQLNPFATEFKKSKFKIQDFCKICGIDYENGNNYITIKEHIKKIADKSWWITLENGKQTLLRWIEKPYIDENNGTIEIVFDNDMKPFLLQLKENFTQYELTSILLFKSKYSIRLFELLESYHYRKLEPLTRVFKIEELKKILDCENYKQIKDFRTRALEPAVKEITENTNYNLEYELIKESRKFVEVEFKLKPKAIQEQIEIFEKVKQKFE
jgi:plasmid replication initiation protein